MKFHHAIAELTHCIRRETKYRQRITTTHPQLRAGIKDRIGELGRARDILAWLEQVDPSCMDCHIDERDCSCGPPEYAPTRRALVAIANLLRTEDPAPAGKEA